jgi:hypothetical protein
LASNLTNQKCELYLNLYREVDRGCSMFANQQNNQYRLLELAELTEFLLQKQSFGITPSADICVLHIHADLAKEITDLSAYWNTIGIMDISPLPPSPETYTPTYQLTFNPQICQLFLNSLSHSG